MIYVSTGCPFRHSDVDILQQKLQSLSVSSDAVSEVFVHNISHWCHKDLR